MSSNKKGPPPRPPAPRLGVGSFSFKALEEEEEEDLTKYTGQFDLQVQKEKKAQQERSEPRMIERQMSGGHTEPKSPIRQNSFDRIKDIKDKITKRIETFSSDSTPAARLDEKDKSSKQQSLNGQPDIGEKDLPAIVPVQTQTLFSSPPNSQNVDNTDVKISQDSDVKNDQDESDQDIQYFEARRDDTDNDTDGKAERFEEDDLEMVDEYFNPEASEDFSDLPGVVARVRQRKRFIAGTKITPVIPTAPVSMSKLSKKLKDEDSPIAEPTSSVVEKSSAPTSKPATPKKSPGQPFPQTISFIPTTRLIGGIIFVFIYLIVPFPSYIRGMLAGVALSSAGWALYMWIVQPPKPREPIPDNPPLSELPPLPVPEVKDPKGEDGEYKGWMNEIMDYNPESYSINHSHSVNINLEGTQLRLRRPKVNIPKRAMWDEPSPTPHYINQRHFDIEGSKVLLLPPELVKKRLWSKKYPICIALAKDGKKQTQDRQALSDGETGSLSRGNSATKLSTSKSSDTIHGLEIVTEQNCDKSVLYLFARTCREKEEWFKRFSAASKGSPLKNHVLEIRQILNKPVSHKRSNSLDSVTKQHKRHGSTDSTSSGTPSPTVEDHQFLPSREDIDLEPFVHFMSRLMPKEASKDSQPSSPAHVAGTKEGKSGGEPKSTSRSIICDPVLLPINALLGRCFWDFLKDQYWGEKVKEKLQKKLSKIHIPYFIEELQISAIDLGTEVPVVRRANRPYIDELGFWVDLDVTYSGKFKMTIETKVNLLKLKKKESVTSIASSESNKSAVNDSEEEDSAESSTDEEEEANFASDESQGQGGGAGKKIMKYLTKITASKYFQSATENKYIKKAMTEVSNTPLTLNVEVQKLNGTLAINIPPPPTDRLWYGFRGNPQLWLVAKPKVGEREVTMSHITDWIEKKLALEFQHVLVMPNMDDLVIPILMAGDLGPMSPGSPSPYSTAGSEV